MSTFLTRKIRKVNLIINSNELKGNNSYIYDRKLNKYTVGAKSIRTEKIFFKSFIFEK